MGKLVRTKKGAIVLKVADSDSEFVLIGGKDEKHTALFDKLKAKAGLDAMLRVSGRIDGYSGRWPDVLRVRPTNPRRIIVNHFEVASKP